MQTRAPSSQARTLGEPADRTAHDSPKTPRDQDSDRTRHLSPTWRRSAANVAAATCNAVAWRECERHRRPRGALCLPVRRVRPCRRPCEACPTRVRDNRRRSPRRGRVQCGYGCSDETRRNSAGTQCPSRRGNREPRGPRSWLLRSTDLARDNRRRAWVLRRLVCRRPCSLLSTSDAGRGCSPTHTACASRGVRRSRHHLRALVLPPCADPLCCPCAICGTLRAVTTLHRNPWMISRFGGPTFAGYRGRESSAGTRRTRATARSPPTMARFSSCISPGLSESATARSLPVSVSRSSGGEGFTNTTATASTPSLSRPDPSMSMTPLARSAVVSDDRWTVTADKGRRRG